MSPISSWEEAMAHYGLVQLPRIEPDKALLLVNGASLPPDLIPTLKRVVGGSVTQLHQGETAFLSIIEVVGGNIPDI